MSVCTHCGATLADNAQYCMQCGTPSVGPPRSGSISAPTFLGPAVICGTAMGVLSSAPLAGCLCCMWMLGGGALAAWLVGRKTEGGPRELTYGDGAFAGVLTGVWGAIVATVAAVLPRLLFPDFIENQQAALEAILNDYPAEAAAEVRQVMEILFSNNLLGTLVALVSNLVIYGLFAMLGGIILVGVFRSSSRGQESGGD